MKVKDRFWLRALVLLAVIALPSVILAQIDRGAIVGTVTDATGSLLPNATIKVTNNATGVAVTTSTNSNGQYQVLALNPGTYAVEASATGMKAQTYPTVEIHVQSRPAVDFKLQVGAVTETITVSEQAQGLQTQTAELGAVVDSKKINDLPLNGRVYAQLALLEAGAGKYYSGPNETADRFSVNGNSEMQNYFALDGVDNNSGSTNQQDNSMQVVQPPPDAIQEFKVQTRTYSAEFGNAAGGVVNVSTKSGTNQFHGDVWDYLRNDKLDANTFFNNRNNVKRGHFTQNQYGATFGGPILKNRTFFFVDFQGFNSRKQNTQYATVPTPLMKQGNFTELPYALATVVPSQSGCITGNVIKASCVDPTAAKLLALYPDPNIASAVALEGKPGSFGGTNYQYQTGSPNDTYSGDVRIDHNVNEKNHISGRFSTSRISTLDPPWTSNGLAGASNWASQNSIHGNSLNLSWTDTLSTSMLNEVRFGFNRMFALKEPPGSQGLGQSAASSYGLNMPETQYSTGLPPIGIGGITWIGSSFWRPQQQVSQVYQLMDNLAYLKGRHSLKFGYQYYRLNSSFLDIQAPQGSLGATGIYTNTNGFGLSDFMLGDMSWAHSTTPTVPHTFRPGHSFYGQDDWRVSDKLTLNLGLRYELFAPLLEHDNALANFNASNGGQIIPVSQDASGWEERSLIKPDRNNFAPRVGFAYQLLNKMVVRGGYGIFYQHSYRFGSESVMSLNPPFISDVATSTNQGSTTPLFILSQGYPISATILSSSSTPLYNLQIRAQDPNQRSSYVQQSSFGVQYEITGSTLVSADYVGNFGRKMARLRNLNQGEIVGTNADGSPKVVFPYANLNNGSQHAFLEYAVHDGNTNYNALQLSLRRQFSRGLAYGISYTWSHNIADFNTPINGDFTPQNVYDMASERGDSALDVRHRLVGNVTWALPIGQGGWILNNGGRLARTLGGWQVNSIVTLQTGSPFTITAPDMSGTGGNHASRANCVGDPFAGASGDWSSYVTGGGGFYINPAAFSIPTAGKFGSCSPFSVHGPGYKNVDISLFKSFAVTESKRIEFRGEFFNAFNFANFASPSSYIGDPNSFGKVYNTVGDPREIQLALKFYF